MQLIVTGMHRSGTSALTQLLNNQGFQISSDEFLLGPHESNPEGHFEDIRILAINEKMLTEAGGAWDNPWQLQLDLISQETINQAREVWEQINSEKVEVIKDPRFCLLIPVWNQIWQEQNSEIHIIRIFRHPIQVAKSLETRNNFDLKISEKIWEFYCKSLLKNSRDYQTTDILHRDLINNPMKAIQQIMRIKYPINKPKFKNIINKEYVHYQNYSKTKLSICNKTWLKIQISVALKKFYFRSRY